MPDNSDNDSQNPVSAGSKARRKASMFFKKAMRQDESAKDETIQKLQEEKRKLKQELVRTYSRIRELELLTTRTNHQQMPTTSLEKPIPVSPEAASVELLYASEGVENRDDDGSDNDDDYDDDESTGFSVEVEAITRGSTVERAYLDIENELDSTAPSATTVPTGNDKKSNLERRQREIRHKLRRGGSLMSTGSNTSKSSSSSKSSRRAEEAYLDYFSRRNSPPLESIHEIETRLSLDEDTASTTSELTASIASSTMLSEERASLSSALLSGRRIPLPVMKSLLRISSAESSSDVISFVPDDEPVLFGEI